MPNAQARALTRDLQSRLNACCGLSKFQHQWLRDLVTQPDFLKFVLIDGSVEKTFNRETSKLTPLNVLWYDTGDVLHLDRIGVNHILRSVMADGDDSTEAPDQLTEDEARQLRAMLNRHPLSVLVGALGVLCEERRTTCAQDEQPRVARLWADASVELTQTERRIRHKMGE